MAIMYPPASKNINPWFILAIGALVGFIANGVRMSYGVFVVPLEEAFNLSRLQSILPFSLNMVIWGLMQPVTGALMDYKGPRKAIILAVILMSLGFAVTAMAQDFWYLMLGYGLLAGGASSGLNVAPFSLLVARWFKHQRGRALGYILAGIPLGTLVFSPLAANLIIDWGWRGAFLGLAAIMLLAALPLSWFFLREPPEAREGDPALSLRQGFIFSSEVRQAAKTGPYWLLMVTYFGCGFTGLFLMGHLPAIALEHNFSPQQGATALGLVGGAGAVGSIFGGWASDRFGRYKSLAVGYLVRAAGMFLLAFSASDVTGFYMASIIAGAPMFFTISITQLLIYEIFGPGIAGRMIGLIFLLHQVGSTVGPYFGGWVFESSGTYLLALVVGGLVLCNSAFWSWRLQGVAQRYIAARAVGQR
ncbi:MAG: MFS transporter [Chloroflexi bacterium]|nr:MFS transporter [Chloroflexota bacterium]